METTHQLVFGNATNMDHVGDESVELVVTSPPYPMIEMWDDIFASVDPRIRTALDEGKGSEAFELMNTILDKVWAEIYRVLVPGGITCINIGDATRTVAKNFQLFTNHSRFLQKLHEIGFQALPEIIWRKQTNAPNKFMGSGMYPPGAYVTLEHEFILVLRKGRKREFKSQDSKIERRKSAYFWEERNQWFSDVWEFRGTGQRLKPGINRERSAAYPFDLAYRLINMFSIKRDTVLDPFLGTGTTSLAAMSLGRNSVGYEIDPSLRSVIEERVDGLSSVANTLVEERIASHLQFVRERVESKGPLKYTNDVYKFPVMTKQEIDIVFDLVDSISQATENTYIVHHKALMREYEQENDGSSFLG